MHYLFLILISECLLEYSNRITNLVLEQNPTILFAKQHIGMAATLCMRSMVIFTAILFFLWMIMFASEGLIDHHRIGETIKYFSFFIAFNAANDIIQVWVYSTIYRVDEVMGTLYSKATISVLGFAMFYCAIKTLDKWNELDEEIEDLF